MRRSNKYYNTYEWCCDDLEEHTSTPGGWEGRVVEIDRDGTINLLRAQPGEGGNVGIRQIPFDYCPFCGAGVQL